MSVPSEKIDSHQHFWRRGEGEQPWRGPEHAALDRDYQPADLREHMRAAAIARSIVIQADNSAAENDRLLDYARTEPTVAGVVAWLPLDRPAVAGAMIGSLRERTEITGVRALVGRGEMEWARRPDTCAVLHAIADADLALDVVPITPAQLQGVHEILERVPGLRIVIDHLGRPPVEAGGWEPWARLMGQLAEAPGAAVKVSVGIDALTAWSRWAPKMLQRYVDHVTEAFGPRRMMLGSNWPVIELRCAYGAAWADLERCLGAAGLAGADLDAVTGGTARSWYRLDG